MLKGIVSVFTIYILFFFIGCTQVDDGSLAISNSHDIFEGEGFFLRAKLDSGAFIHLATDTLYIELDSIWSFSNCALKNIWISTRKADSILILEPKIQYQTKVEDCPSPLYRPDTIVKYLIDTNSLKGISQINIYNNVDSLLDTILVRRGSFSVDTFNLYIDSLYDSIKALPIRTKGSPSLLKVLDSITPRTFYWRTMKSTCSFRMDKCDKIVLDTIFPNSWSVLDTTLVPIRMKCSDSTYTYCKSAGWVNDSLTLGNIEEHLDTIFHTHLYYIEVIPECASINKFTNTSYKVLREMVIERELFSPDDSEISCGPSTEKDMFWYDLNSNHIVPDSIPMDSLKSVWKKAAISSSK